MKKDSKFTKWNSKFNINKILNLIKKGYNIKQISNIIEIPNRRLGEMLKHYNISINSSGHKILKNNDFFSIIDSEIKAYLLGYIIADGCVSIEPKKKNGIVYSYSKRLSFNVSVDDKEIINLLKFNISSKSKIKEYHNNKGAISRKKQLSLRFSSSKIVDDLIKLNILPNKTYHSDFKFDFKNMNEHLIRHFIRGFFDGDGSIGKCDISFVSTSIHFLEQIEKYIKSKIPQINYRYYSYKGKTIDYHKLYFNIGYDIRTEIYNLLYKDSNYFLTRKKIKFNIDNTVLTN